MGRIWTSCTGRRILARLGPELTGDLYVESSQRDIVPGHDLDEIEPQTVAPDTAQGAAKGPVALRRPERRRRHRAEGRRFRAEGKGEEGFKVSKFQGFKVESKDNGESSGNGKSNGEGFKVSKFQGFKVESKDNGSGNGPTSGGNGLAWGSQMADAGMLDRVRAGSNNWVISGAHTQSGRPLLANDMHLPHRIPNTWYEAHLTCGDFDVAGVTLPGAPWVIVGHNRRIAWGFTNLGPDVEDVFVENFNAQGEYQTPEGWRKPEVRHEVIHVKRGRDVEMDVLVTRHGPIISGEMKNEPRQLALKWAIFDTGLSLPFYAVDSAQNWEEFRAAFARLQRAGAERGVCATWMAISATRRRGWFRCAAWAMARLPVSGADDAHEWTGYVPFEEMPSVYNPPSGIIATANGRVTADGYKYSITKEWESPYRTERIYRVLRQDKKFSAADMLALADGCGERSGQVCGRADGVCGGPDAGSERARQERGGYSAALRREDQHGLGGRGD